MSTNYKLRVLAGLSTDGIKMEKDSLLEYGINSDQVDRELTASYAAKIVDAIKARFAVPVNVSTKNNFTVITVNNGHMNMADGGNSAVLTPKGLSDVIEPWWNEFRKKGWTFSQPVSGSFSIGVPAIKESVGSDKKNGTTDAPSIPEKLFTKKARVIVNGLLKRCDINDALKMIKKLLKSDEVENAEELQKAQDVLTAMKLHEDLNAIRKAAGLPLLEKKDDFEDDVEDAEADSDSESDEEEKDDIPSIVKKMAAKLLKNGMPEEDALADLLQKVYQAGYDDGQKEAAADSKTSDE